MTLKFLAQWEFWLGFELTTDQSRVKPATYCAALNFVATHSTCKSIVAQLHAERIMSSTTALCQTICIIKFKKLINTIF